MTRARSSPYLRGGVRIACALIGGLVIVEGGLSLLREHRVRQHSVWNARDAGVWEKQLTSPSPVIRDLALRTLVEEDLEGARTIEAAGCMPNDSVITQQANDGLEILPHQ